MNGSSPERDERLQRLEELALFSEQSSDETKRTLAELLAKVQGLSQRVMALEQRLAGVEGRGRAIPGPTDAGENRDASEA